MFDLNLNNATGNIGTETVKYTWAGDTLTATVSDGARIGTVLFTVEFTNPATGAYHVTLKDNVLAGRRKLVIAMVKKMAVK